MHADTRPPCSSPIRGLHTVTLTVESMKAFPGQKSIKDVEELTAQRKVYVTLLKEYSTMKHHSQRFDSWQGGRCGVAARRQGSLDSSCVIGSVLDCSVSGILCTAEVKCTYHDDFPIRKHVNTFSLSPNTRPTWTGPLVIICLVAASTWFTFNESTVGQQQRIPFLFLCSSNFGGEFLGGFLLVVEKLVLSRKGDLLVDPRVMLAR